MQKPFTRFLVYLLVLVSLYAVFGGLIPVGSPSPYAGLLGKFAFYGTYYGLLFGAPMLVFEVIFRCIRWARRRRPPGPDGPES